MIAGAVPGRQSDRTREAGDARAAATAVPVARQALAAAMLLLTAAVVARYLGPHGFGVLAGGLAAYWLALGLAAAGFSARVVGELAAHPQEEPKVLAEGLRGQAAWCAALGAALALAGLGARDTRGLVMLVLAPAVLCSGASVARQVAAIRSRSPHLHWLELAALAAQCLTAVALAARHASPVLLAADICVWTCLGALPSRLVARRHVRRTGVVRGAAVAFARGALPLGLACSVAFLSLLLDVVVLTWLAPAAAVGRYAAAMQILVFVVAVPGILIALRARTLLAAGAAGSGLDRGVARLVRAVLLAAVPLAAVAALLAGPLVRALLGPAYLGAVPLVRVLMLAAVLASAATVVATIAAAAGRVGRQLIAGAAGAIAGIAALLVLEPHRGASAAAWAAVVSPGVVIAAAPLVLRGRVGLRAVVRETLRAQGGDPVTDPRLGASALVAAGELTRGVRGVLSDPAGATAAAAMAFGGRASLRPRIGEARRAALDPRRGEQGLLVGLGVTVLVLAAVVVARPHAPSGPAPAGAAARVRVAEAGELAIRYAAPWRSVTTAVPGSSALVSPGAVALASGRITLAAGALAHSAAVPGGVPPALLAQYGAPGGSTVVRLGGHPVAAYRWTRAGSAAVVALVLPGADGDLAEVCAAPSPAGLDACERVALGAQAGRATLVDPGPPMAASAAIERVLAPAAAARGRLGGLAQSTLAARVAPARSASGADATAAAALAPIAVPGRDAAALAAMVAALRAESGALAALAQAAARSDRAFYTAAVSAAERASAVVAGAVAPLRQEALHAPAMAPLELAPAPVTAHPRTAPHPRPAQRKSSPPAHDGAGTRTASHTPVTPIRSAPVVRAPVVVRAAPVVRSYAPVTHAYAPVTHTSTPVTHSSPPAPAPSHRPAPKPSTSKPAPTKATSKPTTVVVPVGRTKNTDEGKAVVVPVG